MSRQHQYAEILRLMFELNIVPPTVEAESKFKIQLAKILRI